MAIITGLFYFVGGAYHIGQVQVLGWSYLAGLQSAEYIFAGSELLLMPSFLFVVVGSVIVVAAFASEGIKHRHFPRRWELGIFVSLIFILSIFLIIFTLHAITAGRRLITNGACPIVLDHSRVTTALFLVGGTIALSIIVSRFFAEQQLRLAFLACGLIMALLPLYDFGWITGAETLYGSFEVAELASPSIWAGVDFKVLVLGADDKNLVVLVPDEDHTGHPEPRYLLRSEIKAFRLVGTSSINDFFCKQAKAISKQNQLK